MAEVQKLRLVRCPKCDNLLPELQDLSVYRCGGCGALLRAKKKEHENGFFPEKSDEGRFIGVAEKLESLVNKWGDCLSVASKNENEIDGVSVGRRKERIFVETKPNTVNSCCSAVVKEDLNVREGDEDSRFKQSVAEKNYWSIDKNVCFSEHRDDQWVRGTNYYTKVNRFDLVNSSIGENSARQRKDFARSVRTRMSTKPRDIERAGSDEGSSTCELDSYNGHNKLVKNSNHLNAEDGVKELEYERFELLRKLDELKEHLSRSYNVAEKPGQRNSGSRTPPDLYGSKATCNVSMRPPSLEGKMAGTRYLNYSHRPVSSMNHHHHDMLNFHTPRRHILNEIAGIEEPFTPQMGCEYLMAKDKDFGLDSHASYPQETFYHPPTCSCLPCFNQNWLVPPQVHPNVIGNRRLTSVPVEPNLYHPINPVTFRPDTYNDRGAYTSLHSHDPQPNSKWRNYLDSENGSHGQNFPRRGVTTNGIGRFYHPIAGGAPFISCSSCFELLKLPRKLIKKNKNQQKLRCGGCSRVMALEIENKKLISISLEPSSLSAEVVKDSSGSLNGSISCSGDFNCPAYNSLSSGTNHNSFIEDRRLNSCESSEKKHNLLIEDQRLNSDESEKRHCHTSTSSTSSKEENPDCMVVIQRDVSNPVKLPPKNALSPTSPSSPLWQQSDSPKYAVRRFGQENEGSFTDNEEIVLNRIPSQQNSRKDISVTSEVDASFNEYLDTCISHDSADVSKEEDQHKIDKGSTSSLVGFIKKSFRDFSRSNQSLENEMPNVSVNGELVPGHVVRKAEKLAGPIRPGDYWYDFRAGFWGVMGHPCLGIIPPFIEEFNYPMPTNCAAGNTEVYVNRRELNQKDLDLLACRGLPTTRNRFYIIEFSGRVQHEDSGEEFSLGKLAPTVEKAKHGFGMRMPKIPI